MVDAAFALFDEQGYDATTVDAIVERAGVSRSTFFRAFGSKEDVIFPHHPDLRARIEARLAAGSAETRVVAVREAAGLVLEQYLSEGDVALARYRLTRTVPALRGREIASMLGYQQLFREALLHWLDGPDAELRAELLAAGIVTGHNVILRRWLRGQTDDPRGELSHALDLVMESRGLATAAPHGALGTTVVVVESNRSGAEVADVVRRALEG
ncbi:MAG: TetR family transcriptional regulator [Nocardioides sp.]|nr:TetR family transcriptional regulator [Nocardioides sp.]